MTYTEVLDQIKEDKETLQKLPPAVRAAQTIIDYLWEQDLICLIRERERAAIVNIIEKEFYK